MADQGVTEVGIGRLVDTPILILIFDKEKLPDKVMAAWYAMDVMTYVPSPKRCFK